MPHPKSPHAPCSVDLSGGLGAVLPAKEQFCTPMPLHSQVPLASGSPRPPTTTSTMATTFQDSATSNDSRQPTPFMSLEDSNSVPWAPHNGFPASSIAQDAATFHGLPMQLASDSTGLYGYGQNGPSYSHNYNLMYSANRSGSSCPRSYANDVNLTGLPQNINMPESYPPAAYHIEPLRPQEAMDLSDQGASSQPLGLSDDYDIQYGSNIKMEECSGYSSPYDSDLSRASTPHDELPFSSHELRNDCGGDDVAIDKEQPYAQLIYRALMEAPNHTMILREIYDWFKRNTDKAADKETKGWQNSIRHNLSMNGAFEKVDQHCEDARKGFMWKLTDEAIREGVKSTTRYRSKQPNKRGHRSLNPLPQRQASGAKGGQAARRSAKARKSGRYNEVACRSEPYHPMSRSVPASFETPFGVTEAPMAYPSSPQYSDTDFGYTPKHGDFGSPMIGSGLDLFASPTRSYSGSLLSQQMSCMDPCYVLEQGPADPLFTNSPSPSADEPRTPDSQNDWNEELTLGHNGPYVTVFDDPTYREFTG